MQKKEPNVLPMCANIDVNIKDKKTKMNIYSGNLLREAAEIIFNEKWKRCSHIKHGGELK